jgi:hypothetical protein
MGEIKITVAQLYLGVMESLPIVIESEPGLLWNEIVAQSIKCFVDEIRNDESYLEETLPITEDVILEEVKRYPQIKIVKSEGEKR